MLLHVSRKELLRQAKNTKKNKGKKPVLSLYHENVFLASEIISEGVFTNKVVLSEQFCRRLCFLISPKSYLKF